MICGALLVAVLLTGCDTSNQPTTSSTSMPLTVMTSQPAPLSGTAYPAADGYPAPASPAATAYPAPTSVP